MKNKLLIIIIIAIIIIIIIIGFVFLYSNINEDNGKNGNNSINGDERFTGIYDKEILIKDDEYYIISLEICSGKDIEYRFDVNESYNNRQIDAYIIEKDDLQNYPSEINAPFMKKNMRHTNGTYHIVNWGTWYLIIDNILSLEEKQEYEDNNFPPPEGDVLCAVYLEL